LFTTRSDVIASISAAWRRNASRAGEFATVNGATGKGDRKCTTENSLTGCSWRTQTVGSTNESKCGTVELHKGDWWTNCFFKCYCNLYIVHSPTNTLFIKLGKV